MSPTPDPNELHKYVVILKDVWSTFGLPTIILLILLLIYIGVIPSPLGATFQTVEDISASLNKHLARDKEMIFYMRQTCASNAKLAKTPIEDCLWHE